MAEVSNPAQILISVSWQALKRIEKKNSVTAIPDCVVLIVFAGFFIEANLNHIFEILDIERKLSEKDKKFIHAGLKKKIKYFYKNFIDQTIDLYSSFDYELNLRFPGISDLIEFRNGIAHGKVDFSKTNSEGARQMREQAKNIVDDLFDITYQKTGIDIPRRITYESAMDVDVSKLSSDVSS